jgi:hypothetical protein
VRTLRQRALLHVDPVLLLMTGTGDILHRQYTRLYPAYDARGGAFPDWAEALFTLEDLIALVVRVERDRPARDADLERLRESEGGAAAIGLAAAYRERGWPERAAEVLRSVLRTGDDVAAREALAELLEATGSTDEARAEFETLSAAHPDDDRVPRWRFEALRLRLESGWATPPTAEPGSSDAEDPVVILQGWSEAESDDELHARIHLTIAKAARVRGDEDAFAEALDALARHVGTEEDAVPPAWSAPVLLSLLEVELMAGSSWRRRAAEHGWHLMRRFPDSIEAQLAKHGMLGATLQMEPGRLQAD